MALTEMVIMPGEDYQAICDSVRAKTGGTALLKSGEVSPAIDSIEKGIDTQAAIDVAATASDVAAGKISFVNGEKLEGSLPTVSRLDLTHIDAFPSGTTIEGSIVAVAENDSDVIVRSGKNVFLKVPLNSTYFGNATADDVVEDKTFTSANGLKITGNIEPMGNFVWGNAAIRRRTNGDIQLTQEFHKNSLFRDGETISLYTDSANFGNATAEDVAEGTTFTSANGLNIPGKAKIGGGMVSKSGTVNISESTNEFVINTGLSSIESIIVLNKSTTATGNRTHYWAYSPIGDNCCYYTKLNTYSASWYFVSSSGKLTINEGGTVTVMQYSSSNPIILGDYSWYAFGTE